jgi:hypothetical protein
LPRILPTSLATLFWFSSDDDFVVGFAAREAAFLGGELKSLFAVEFGLVDEFFDALGEALHGVGGSAGVGGIFGADEEGDFAFGGTVFEGGEKLGEFATAEFFVELGDFAGDACSAVAEDFAGVGYAFRDAMRRFVENDGSILDAQAFEGATAFAAAGREKADEKKFFIGQTARGERGQKRGWPGDGDHGDMMSQAEGDEAMARIRNERHAGVAYERDFCALLERD